MEDQELKELIRQLTLAVQTLTMGINALAWRQQVITVPAQPSNPFVSPTTQPSWQSHWQSQHNCSSNSQMSDRVLAFNLQN